MCVVFIVFIDSFIKFSQTWPCANCATWSGHKARSEFQTSFVSSNCARLFKTALYFTSLILINICFKRPWNPVVSSQMSCNKINLISDISWPQHWLQECTLCLDSQDANFQIQFQIDITTFNQGVRNRSPASQKLRSGGAPGIYLLHVGEKHLNDVILA